MRAATFFRHPVTSEATTKSSTHSMQQPPPPRQPPTPPCPPTPPLAPYVGGASTDFGNRWSFTSEPWATPWIVENADPSKVLLRGNQRAYLTRRGGQSIQYEKMRLLGKTLRYTVDVSQVGCGCNARCTSSPCGNQTAGTAIRIQCWGSRALPEIDLFEGNAKALATTLHTEGESC